MADRIHFETLVAADESIPEGYMKHYVAVPPAIAERFPGAKRLRGSIDGATFSRAVFTTDEGELRLRFGRDWLTDSGLVAGDVVTVDLDEDQDPDKVDLPAELALLLEADPLAEHVWEDLTPGRQRSLVYGIERAKRTETRQRRAEIVIEQLVEDLGLD